MGIQDKTKKELISELKELQQENNSLKTLYKDISGFKKPEMDLVASEIRYRSLFESAKDGILILDAETGKIIDVNPFLIDLLGYSKESFIKKTVWEIGFFNDIIDNKDKFLELQQKEYVRYEDLPLKTADGQKIHVEFVSNVYLENNQKVIQCNIRDITKRKEAEAVQEKTRKKLAEIKRIADEESKFIADVIDTVREPLLVLDDGLRVIEASRSFYKFFKVNAEGTIGRLIYELGNHQWDIPKLRELLEKILPKKTTFDNYEVEHNFSSIGTRIMLLNARQIKRRLGKEKIILLAFEDITERKRAERRLSEKNRLNNEYLDILLDRAHAPIVIWNSSLVIKRFNPEFEKLSGYSKSEVQDKKIEMLFPKNEIESTIEAIKNNIHDENSEVIEINILTKNNKIRTVLWNSANIFDEDDKHVVSAIAQDITGRKQSEEKLRESEFFFRESQRAAVIGSYRWDFISGFWQSSEILDQIFGIDKSYGRSVQGWIDIIYPDDREMMDRYLREEVIANRNPFNKEYRILSKSNGEIRWVNGLGKVDFDADGKAISLIGTIQNITDRKRAEEALLESEKKIRSILENSADAIFIADQNGRYTYTNKAVTTMLGFTQEEMMSKTIIDMAPKSRVNEYLEIFSRLGTEGKVFAEIDLLKNDGNYISTDLNSVILPNGMIYGSCRDITERKQLEKEKNVLTYNLNERVKELTCLYSISSIIGSYNISLDEMFKQIVSIIPSGLQYPDITCARIVISNNEYKTTNFKETKWKQSSDIQIDGTISGFIEVFYLKEISAIDESPFLKEEINLLNIIAERLGHLTKLKKTLNTLQESVTALQNAQEIAKMGSWDYDVVNNANQGLKL